MNLLLALPILIPLATAATLLIFWKQPTIQRWLGAAGGLALLATAVVLLEKVCRSGIQVIQIGAWPAPYGITLVADRFSAIMVLLAAITGFVVAVYSWQQIDRQRAAFGYYSLLHILLMGVCGAFLTGDIFNLYVWFEVMLMASFVLLALGGERGQLEGAMKYVTLNLISSAAFLAGIAIIYAATGTLNMADMARKLADFPDVRVQTVLAVLFMVAFGVKAAAFPFFFWLPASYHTPPAAISAVFAGLLTKVGVYALIRVFTLLFIHEVHYTHGILLVASGLTMATGVLGAVAQNEFRRILSFHIVSQIGYMMMGLAIFTPLSLAGSVFYIVHHIVVKTNLFLVSGVAEHLYGTGKLANLGGMFKSRAGLSILFLISALSLGGVPPLSGFFAKLILIRAGLEAEHYLIVATALVVGLLTLFSMTKIWNEAFWKDQPIETPDAAIAADRSSGLLYSILPMAALAGITLTIGALAGPVFGFCTTTAEQLLDQAQYLDAVLGDRS